MLTVEYSDLVEIYRETVETANDPDLEETMVQYVERIMYERKLLDSLPNVVQVTEVVVLATHGIQMY